MFTVNGCYKLVDNVCHVYTSAKNGRDEMRVLGHEVRHCFDGYYHD